MNNGNNQKIPCGGFRIGDGLTMDGDTLKSLGGAYVKVKANINDDDELTFEFMDDSPLKTFGEIEQKAKTSLVTLLLYFPNEAVYSLFLEVYASDSLIFCAFSIGEDTLSKKEISIHSDNKITLSQSQYTLTPAT